MSLKKIDGVEIRCLDEPIETVTSEKNTIKLLSQGDGTEVWHQVIRSGGRIGLAPANDWEGLEAFYVQEGTLRCELEEETIYLTAGATVSAMHLTKPVIFTAESDVTIIYVCSRPTFHLVSQQIKELMDLAVRVEQKDGYTAGHCRRIQDLCIAIAEKLKLSSASMDRLMFGAFLHDLGKAGIPDQILKKPGPLTPEEWEIIKKHPTIGREMVERTCIASVGPIIEQHHERLDGTGYPYGLKDEDILIEAKIVAVADAFDAMTTERPYRKARTIEFAISELRKEAGTHFSPEVVDTLCEIIANQRKEM